MICFADKVCSVRNALANAPDSLKMVRGEVHQDEKPSSITALRGVHWKTHPFGPPLCGLGPRIE